MKTLSKAVPKKSKKLLKVPKAIEAHSILVPVEQGDDDFPAVSEAIPPGTFYKVHNSKTDHRVTFLTIMPGDLQVAWDTCGRCHAYVTMCRCKAGVHCPRSVEYIFDQMTAKQDGEEWTHLHRNYKGSILTAKGSRQQDGDRPYSLPGSHKPGTKPKALTAPPKKLLSKPKAPAKPLAPMAKEATDAGALMAAATRMADDLESQVERELGMTKTLAKKPQAKTLSKPTTLKKRK